MHCSLLDVLACPSCRNAFELSPSSVANGIVLQHRQQSLIELFQVLVHGLGRCADEVRGDAFVAAFELALMEESQAG